jgi:uncharacterized protein with LGFP repeats
MRTPMRTMNTGIGAALAVALLTAPAAQAADISKVDSATRQVETGAKKMGDGKVMEGAGETAKGVGNTVVEGAKYTGEKFKEAGQAADKPAKTTWQHMKEGGRAFAQTVSNFFSTLFSN